MSNYKVEPQKGKLYTLTINNKTYTIHQETVIKYNLLNHSNIDTKTLPALLQDDTFFQGYDIALKKLSIKAYTPKSLRTMLNNQGIPKTIHQKIINTLKTHNYYNEETLIDMRTDDIINHLQKGPIFLKQKLLSEGFDDALVDDVVSRYTEEKQHAIATAIMQKKVHTFKTIPYHKAKEKLTQFCIQRGFHHTFCLKEVEAILSSYSVDEEALTNKMKQAIENRYDLTESKDKEKAMRYLLRQGFTYTQIKKVIEE